jgi:hypothetical protein
MLTPVHALSGRDQAALRRAIQQFKFEQMDDGGILMPKLGLQVGGYFRAWTDADPADVIVAKNRIVNEALDLTLDLLLGNGTVISTLYVALFSGNVTPAATWTGATWPALATEFTNYTEATRVEYEPAGASSQSIDNTATPAQFTADTGGGTVYGAALTEASAKGATTGKLIAAARFPSNKVLDTAELLNVTYGAAASSS